MFLGGDGVNLARPETAEALHGIGTGSVAEHWDALVAAGVPISLVRRVERGARHRRGYERRRRAGAADALVELAEWSERTLVY